MEFDVNAPMETSSNAVASYHKQNAPTKTIQIKQKRQTSKTPHYILQRPPDKHLQATTL
jgi:hypothetical protein